jgi:hypothetical protein
MYYKVTAKYKTDEDNTTFEFIADTEDIQHIYDAAEDEGEEILDIREMTFPELIEHEKRNLMQTVARTYIFAKYRDYDFQTRLQKFGEMDWEGEEFFLALKSFNERQDYLRRLMHCKKKGKIDLDEFLKIMNGLVDCTAEEDIDNMVQEMQNKTE